MPHIKKLLPVFVAGLIALVAIKPAQAVYAPIPPVEQGRLLTVYVSGGGYYDTNIFGAPSDGVGSFVFQIQPNAVFNLAVADQTFLSASYQLSLDYFENRPGEKLLASQSINARIAHTFSARFEGELSDNYQIVKNPESLMPGIAGGVINPDQSYDYNHLEGKMTYNVNKRTALKGKFRALDFAYDNPVLSQELDHGEYTVGLEAVRSARQNLQISAEYRFEAIRYDHGGDFKDKNTHFLFGGADYAATKYTAYSARLGIQAVQRKNGENAVLPYVELGVKHDYSDGSYISGGYKYSVDEASNLYAYTDMYTHHLFANVQKTLTKTISLTGAVDWQPSQLNGRPHIAENINESYIKLGVALIWTLRKQCSISVTCDYDDINSDDPGRDLRRLRTGARVRWVF